MTKFWKVATLLMLLLCVSTGSAMARGKTVQVQVVDGSKQSTIVTQEQSVEKFMAAHNIKLGRWDKVDKAADYVLKDKDVLTVDRAVPVYVTVDGAPKMLQVQAATVAELKAELEARDGRFYNIASPAEDTAVKAGMQVSLITKVLRVSTTTEEIPSGADIIEDASMALGTEIILKEGTPGAKQVTVTEELVGGVVVNTKTEEVVLSQPVKALVRKGTNNVITVDGKTLRYRAALKVKATAYTPFDPGCNGITATGTVAGFGTLAVDPKVIPLGSRVYVPGYGMTTATDTGGAIKGNRIDVCYEDLQTALNWGVKNITVYILE